MNVTVGGHRPPFGGPEIRSQLHHILSLINERAYSPFDGHVRYEMLHPFMDGNGRSGRAIWLWMHKGRAPLGFLHTFYYETLQAQQARVILR